MKTPKLPQALKVFGLGLSIIVSIYGCSSVQDEQGDLEENGNEDSANANNEVENNNEANQQNAGNDSGNALQGDNLGTEAVANNVAEQTAVDPNQAPMNLPPEANPAPQTNSVAAPDGSRVVRFITANGTAVRGKAEASSSQIASLNQGDAVVVSIMGGWGMIADGRYVQIDNLSERAVPHAKTANGWN